MKQLLVALAFVLAIMGLAVCIVAPWRAHKRVTIEPANKQAAAETPASGTPKPETSTPATTQETQAPALSGKASAEAPMDGPKAAKESPDTTIPESKDAIIRESQNAHRSQLMKGAAPHAHMAAPTTAALLMNSMDTRSRGAQESVVDRRHMKGHRSSSMPMPRTADPEGEPIPIGSMITH